MSAPDSSKSIEEFLKESGLRVVDVDGAGRCLEATKNFSPGAIIFEEDPLASILRIELWGTNCHGCFDPPAEGQKLQACTRCHVARYCSKACQKNDWADHKHECKLIAQALEGRGGEADTDMLLARLHRAASKGRGWADFGFADLVDSFAGRLDEANRKDVAEQLPFVQRYCARAKGVPAMTEDDMCSAYGRFTSNGIHLLTALLRRLGQCVYLTLSLINHACRPNCWANFVAGSKKLQLRAIDKIAAGTRLSISYHEQGQPRQTRQASLKQMYFFDCSCSMCMIPSPGSPDSTEVPKLALLEAYLCPMDGCEGALLPTADGRGLSCTHCDRTDDPARFGPMLDRVSKLNFHGEQMRQAGEFDTAVAAYRQGLGALEKVCHPLNLTLYGFLNSLSELAMVRDDYETAFALGERALAVQEVVYPVLHPVLALKRLTVGRAALKLGNYAAAKRLMLGARVPLGLLHGLKHPLVAQVVEMLQLVNMALARNLGKARGGARASGSGGGSAATASGASGASGARAGSGAGAAGTGAGGAGAGAGGAGAGAGAGASTTATGGTAPAAEAAGSAPAAAPASAAPAAAVAAVAAAAARATAPTPVAATPPSAPTDAADK